MAPGSAGGDAEKYKNAQDAKHLFDIIGKDVYEQVKNGGAETYKDELKGNLTDSSILGRESAYTTDPCKLIKEKRDKLLGTNSNRYPCKELSGKDAKKEERFSDTLGGQCTYNRIKGNKYNKKTRKDCGACAPYRRLHLCSHNLETIETTNYDSNNAKHKLLLEVCMAAKYEGDLIKTHYTPHQEKYKNTDTASQLCTVLARSFADIGDIVRGRDLYLGNPEEIKQRQQLDENLKTIFKNIYEKLLEDNKTNGVKDRYEDNDGNYYQLREDWWDANRAKVWEAITCNDDDKLANASYFRKTCSDEQGGAQANNKCRCKDKNGRPDDQVPTYFDYVPQYLRWFEEWAEDFCRKKKKKLEDVKRNCRDDSKNLYCSGNGYDCTKTIYKKGKLVIGEHCTNCSVWCRLYEKWIDNQKKEFLKQKEKYETEISNSGSCGGSGSAGGSRKKRAATTTNYDGYEKKFYEKLKEKNNYSDVKNFLELLSKEEVCKKIKDKKEIIDFKTDDNDFHKNINNEGTFYHSQYCKPCPICGVKKTNNGGSGNKWKEKDKSEECTSINLYKPKDNVNPTDVTILKSGDGQTEIAEKLKAFCDKKDSGNSDSSLYDPWKCYKEDDIEKHADDDDDDGEYDRLVTGAGGLCILKNDKNKKEEKEKKTEKEPEQFQKTYNDFFYFWIRRFLNDSMYWRGKVGGCLKNGTKTRCNKKNKCKDDCECFKRWIDIKIKEWENIKKHFKTQKGFELFPYDFVLKEVLKLDELFQNIKEGYGDVKELEGIENMLKEEQKKNKEDEATGVTVGVVGVVL
ncbi:hypothetical protein PFTANZ_06301, partial [Plasmodium falciparum Tanzania (2000708)]